MDTMAHNYISNFWIAEPFRRGDEIHCLHAYTITLNEISHGFPQGSTHNYVSNFLIVESSCREDRTQCFYVYIL